MTKAENPPTTTPTVTKTKVPTATVKTAPDAQKLAVEIAVPGSPELVTCAVCGHQNPKDAGLCVMCSNYLFD